MRFIVLIVCALLSWPASAQVAQTGAGLGAPSSGGGCTAATNFLARTSGLNGTESAAYTTMICGLVTDGLITGTLSGATGCGTVLDALYIFATNTTTTANLNLCGTSFGLTQTGTVTFTADQGYTGNGTTGFLDSGYTPSTAAGNLTLNSASFLSYIRTNRTTAATVFALGATNAAFTAIFALDAIGGGLSTEIGLNDGKPNYTAPATVRGSWVASRTGASAGTVRINATAFATVAATSVSLPNASVYILAANQSGSGAVGLSTDQVSATAWGAGLTPTQMDNLSNRINAYMTALGINVY